MSNAKKIKIIADYLVTTGTQKSLSGNYIMFHTDIVKQFPGISLQWIQEHHREIRDEIDSREETISETWDTLERGEVTGWDMMFGLAYCPNAEDDKEDEEAC